MNKCDVSIFIQNDFNIKTAVCQWNYAVIDMELSYIRAIKKRAAKDTQNCIVSNPNLLCTGRAETARRTNRLGKLVTLDKVRRGKGHYNKLSDSLTV